MKVQLDAQDFLRLCESHGSLYFWDIEATGLKGDYNSILCISIKPFGEQPTTFAVKQVGNDEKVVRDAKVMLEKADCWVTYFGKGFDVKMVNTRLLKWDREPIDKRPHVDMYFSLKNSLLTGRKSQGHLLSWLGTPEEKMTVSADVWNQMAAKIKEYMPTMIARCESDVAGLEALYRRTKHLIRDVTR